MLRNRNIAFFIDVDNVDLTSENFENIIAQLDGMGAILTGKIYGAKERKHKAIYDQAEVKGYKVERPMRIKRRGRRDFDARIFVDVVDTVCHAPSVDAVCIVTASCDLVYLYSYLHGKGIKIISSDENEEASSAMVDEYVDLGRIYDIELPVKPAVKKTVKAVTRPAVATATRSAVRAVAKATQKQSVVESVKQEDETSELLKEIERLRKLAEEQKAEKEAKAKAAEEAHAKAEAEAKARREAEEKAQREIEEAKARVRREAEENDREEERIKEKKAL
ncbi:MAG: NYN domain-containing protein, partial [Clostridia bacterium]|nr:NYN domain-containing protein [Clostridia bacterium]